MKKTNNDSVSGDHSSNKFAVGVLMVTIILLIFGIAFSLMKVGSMDDITGAATVSGTGTVALTVGGTVGIVVSSTANAIQLGTGYLNDSCTSVVINTTAGTVTPTSCWFNSSGNPAQASNITGAHAITNNGTTLVNLTMSSFDAYNAESFICGSSNGCTGSATAIVNVTAVGSTNGPLSACISQDLANNAMLMNATENFTVVLCNNMGFAALVDNINVSFVLRIPADVPSGTTRTLTVTYTGTG